MTAQGLHRIAKARRDLGGRPLSAACDRTTRLLERRRAVPALRGSHLVEHRRRFCTNARGAQETRRCCRRRTKALALAARAGSTKNPESDPDTVPRSRLITQRNKQACILPFTCRVARHTVTHRVDTPHDGRVLVQSGPARPAQLTLPGSLSDFGWRRDDWPRHRHRARPLRPCHRHQRNFWRRAVYPRDGQRLHKQNCLIGSCLRQTSGANPI